jgi:hypothetical protein
VFLALIPILAGALNLLTVIVKFRPEIQERIAESLLVDLFALTVVKADGVLTAKCLNSHTREASFGLMKELIRGLSQIHDTALKLIAPIAKTIQDQKRILFLRCKAFVSVHLLSLTFLRSVAKDLLVFSTRGTLAVTPTRSCNSFI